MVNARGDRTQTLVELLGLPDGEVRYAERFSATVLSPMHQRSFPFDSAVFTIAVESFRADARKLVFRVGQDLMGRSPDISTNEWRLKEMTGDGRAPLLPARGSGVLAFPGEAQR